MAGQVPTTGGRLSMCVLVLTAWGFLVPVTGAGCPTVRLSGSTRLSQNLIIGTYSMTGGISESRPKYRNDESKAPVFFKQGYWHIENENRIRVRDSSFYLEDITGTFEVWDSDPDSDQGEFVADPEAHFSCADITYICKDDKKTIGCPRPDFQQLLIVRALYGQDWACKLSGCTQREGDCTNCNWVSKNYIITRVQTQCTRASGNCILEPSDGMFGGNPCGHIEGDVDTYLRVEHRCINVPTSLGCYQDEPGNNPLLSGRVTGTSETSMTIQKCLTYCRSQSYRYAGVANRHGCRCGSQLQQDSASLRLPITDCTAPCGGDEFQFCGGPSGSQKMEVFEASIGACGGDLRRNVGIIYSPDFPGPYPLDNNCIWNIEVSAENVIRISLELLDISTEDSLTIIEDRSSQTVVTVLNGTSMAEYVSISSNVSLQFRAGRQRAQQTDGFILRYKGVGHCGPIPVIDDVTSVSPNHGGNFAVGQQAQITCKGGRNVTVRCQKDTSFSTTAPFCRDKAMWMAIVGGIVAVLVLLAIVLVVAIFIIRKRRAAQKQEGTTSPGTAAYSAAPTSDSLVLTPGNLSARAPGGENEAEDDLHQYASIRDTGPFSGTEPLYAQPDSGTKKPIELMYAKPMKKKKGSPSGNEEEGIVDNILYEGSVGEERHGQAMNGEQQGLIDNNLYELQ
ncbi:kremen protein 2-like isoform X2 [Branchiostoma lanceolatum]|uniref:kremen protein 2-like isoform X2 n=1 Tax=Branchiostoma lanceolatum TaxID=7740 RepID=UPI0034514C19